MLWCWLAATAVHSAFAVRGHVPSKPSYQHPGQEAQYPLQSFAGRAQSYPHDDDQYPSHLLQSYVSDSL